MLLRPTAHRTSSGSFGTRNTLGTSGTSLITRLATACTAHLERHVANGSILDLGCGTGNTATELAGNAYRTYVGVDISEVCLSKAARRTQESGRADKNHFVPADFLSYVPTQQFDVILFRESMYHVPLGKIKSTLDRYSKYLRDGGVFVVRMGTLGSNGKSKSTANGDDRHHRDRIRRCGEVSIYGIRSNGNCLSTEAPKLREVPLDR